MTSFEFPLKKNFGKFTPIKTILLKAFASNLIFSENLIRHLTYYANEEVSVLCVGSERIVLQEMIQL